MKTVSINKKVMLPGLAIVALVLFGASTVWAQSAGGNFTASVDNTVCAVNTAGFGSFTLNGAPYVQGPGGELKATIKLPNSSPGLLVTPSLVTGMYTDTAVFQSGSSSETAAIVVTVTDAQSGYQTVTLTPNQTCVDTSPGGTSTCPNVLDPYCKCGVVYDERLQYLAASLGSGEFIDFAQATMAAHSFNFTRGQVPGGIHNITLNWYFGCDNGSGQLRTANCNSNTFLFNIAAACAGPGTLTVTQVQQFQHSSQIGTTGQ